MTRVEELKTELQCLGVRLRPQLGREPGARIRQGGAGPAEGVTLLLNGSPASVPFSSAFVAGSPFELRRDTDRWTLTRDGGRLGLRVVPAAEPAFYRKHTDAGVSYGKIALLHGCDCLATTVLQSCAYWGTPLGCRFCGIGLSWQSGRTVMRKRPEDLAQVAVAAAEEGVRHVTLTSGTTEGRELEWELCLEASRAISAATRLPVHVQLMPPISRDRLESLRQAGVTSLGMHLETFDREVLGRLSPCKARLPVDVYREAWRQAVEVFGRGQVESFLLMGLGESAESLLAGCGELAALGVYPYLVPFRPIPGTPLGDAKPLDPRIAGGIYLEAARILETAGLDWAEVEAGCVRCRGCSALPDYQDALARVRRGKVSPERLTWEVVRSGPFLEASLAIRHEVFVEEQGLFTGTDLDGLDPESVHIVARQGQRSLGTVRITPVRDGLWLGSRLGVRVGCRGAVGALLVRKAEEEVLRRGGREFVAHIQNDRVAFFRRCGWQPLSEIREYCGRPHTLMIAAGPLWGERTLADAAAGRRLQEALCRREPQAAESSH